MNIILERQREPTKQQSSPYENKICILFEQNIQMIDFIHSIALIRKTIIFTINELYRKFTWGLIFLRMHVFNGICHLF